MRAEIAQAIEDADFGPGRECKWKCPEPTAQSPLSPFSSCSSCIAEHILALFAERVRGIENPHSITVKWDDPRYMDRIAHESFEAFRTELLKELEP